MNVTPQIKVRDDLPERHRHRFMNLTQTPIGSDFLSTEKLLQELLGTDFSSELDWIFHPPVGPLPRQGWKTNSILSKDQPGRFYIISFDVPRKDGSIFKVFKPGITTKEVISKEGFRGRYRKSDGIRLVVEKYFPKVLNAWALEQKLLAVMHALPWRSPEHIWQAKDIHYKEIYAASKGRYGYKSKKLTWGKWRIMEDTGAVLECHQVARMKVNTFFESKNPYDRDNFKIKDSWKHLGESEWRSWPYSEDSLIKAVEDVIKFSAE